MVRIYRCFIAGLMALFIAFGVWYVVSNLNEQGSTKDGTLVLEEIWDAADGLY